MNSQIITWSISLLALGFSIYNLYLQRRDKKPKLNVTIKRKYFPPSPLSDSDRSLMQPGFDFEIHVRNPTDKTIKLQETVFVDSTKVHFSLPNEWETISEVPSHEKRVVVISVLKFKVWAKNIKLSNPEKGYFLLTDHLENDYKTEKLGDVLSLEPTNNF